MTGSTGRTAASTIIGGGRHWAVLGQSALRSASCWLCIEVDFSLPAERVVRSLNQVIEWRGQPQAIRVDNGPEYASGKLMEWAEKRNIRLEYIQLGKPQQNAYIERYNRTVRGEWLSQYIFETIKRAQD